MDANTPWLQNLARHITGRMLANEYDVLLVLRDIASGESVSTVAAKYDMESGRVVGFTNRMRQLAGYNWEKKYLFVLNHAFDMQIEPVILLTQPYYCTLCNTHLMHKFRLTHILSTHKRLVHELSGELIDYILERWS